jgi:hypothetical protein
MFKVFAFLPRNPNLSHDEYRAGHVGYHCGQSRRLKGIRGYLVNIYANRSLAEALGPLHEQLVRNAPSNFLDHWDGFPEVYFDDQQAWTEAATPEPNRALADGLVEDPDWSLGDGAFLFERAPGSEVEFLSHHLHMHEHCVVPVERVEYKQTKLMQFFRRNPALTEEAFQTLLLREYAPLMARLKNLMGYIVNLRDSDQEAAMRDFFPADTWRFSAAGESRRREFCLLWDGAAELHFPSLEIFAQARQEAALVHPLAELEEQLFDALWYVEVDENLIVLPNRDPAPNFYFR